MSESWMDTGNSYRASYLADEDSVRQHAEVYGRGDDPDVIYNERNEPVPEVNLFDGLGLKRWFGIIDADTYWRRRVREGNTDDKRT